MHKNKRLRLLAFFLVVGVIVSGFGLKNVLGFLEKEEEPLTFSGEIEQFNPEDSLRTILVENTYFSLDDVELDFEVVDGQLVDIKARPQMLESDPPIGVALDMKLVSQPEISIFLDNSSISFEQPPIIRDDRTLVPFRALFEKMGATVDWDSEKRTVEGAIGDKLITLVIDDSLAQIREDGQVNNVKMDVPAQIVNNRTLVPLRFVMENFGLDVNWDSKTRTIDVITPRSVEDDNSSKVSLGSVQDALNESGFMILRQMIKEDYKGKNLMISPVSLFTALSMTANGASNEVLEQMRKYMLFADDFTYEELNEFNRYLLRLLNREENGLELSLANSVWIYDEKDYMIRDSYKDMLENVFHTSLKNFRYSSDYTKINAWIEERTNNRIKDMLEEDNLEPIEDQLMVLVNALYFKGTWANEFKNVELQDKYFNTNEGEVSPDWMRKNEKLKHIKNDDIIGVTLPYALKNEDDKIGDMANLSMKILMPKNKSLDEVLKDFSSNTWNDIEKEFDYPDNGSNVALTMPKFKYESESISMKDFYEALGARLPFDSSQKGNVMWNRMVNENADMVWIDDVVHKTFIEVDEYGTEAAAATAVIMMERLSMPSPPIEILIDRPFVYLITDDETGSILFLGKVENPTI